MPGFEAGHAIARRPQILRETDMQHRTINPVRRKLVLAAGAGRAASAAAIRFMRFVTRSGESASSGETATTVAVRSRWALRDSYRSVVCSIGIPRIISASSRILDVARFLALSGLQGNDAIN